MKQSLPRNSKWLKTNTAAEQFCASCAWKGEVHNVQQREGVSLGSNHGLETATSAAYLTQRIIETSQFTLSLTVATNDTIQTGPSRIVSLSANRYHRSFTLGQQRSEFIFRLRTPLTGENGINPQLAVPDVFSITKPRSQDTCELIFLM